MDCSFKRQLADTQTAAMIDSLVELVYTLDKYDAQTSQPTMGKHNQASSAQGANKDNTTVVKAPHQARQVGGSMAHSSKD